MNSDGSCQTRLTYNSADDAQPAFSPDGNKLAFRSTRDDRYGEIYVMRPRILGDWPLTRLPRLTNNAAEEYYPDWQTRR